MNGQWLVFSLLLNVDYINYCFVNLACLQLMSLKSLDLSLILFKIEA